ncbi:MAG: cation:proton antiporter [Tepidamorphaceae bacterium]|nr:cation:proton antiporter [Rhodobiaceae bacterium]MCC0048950.1 cation:proton antiporter [Rhodobiaceae bacterium]
MIFLAASGIVVPLLQRFRLGIVIGFLIAGMLVGPYGFGRLAGDYHFFEYITIRDPERIAAIGELGVIFLLFMLGLEVSFLRLWQLRRFVLGAGSLQVLISATAIGTSAYLLGVEGSVSFVLGLGFALSSTAIVMQSLYESHRVATQVGRLSMSILLMQDIMVIPILFAVGSLNAGVDTNAWVTILEAVAFAGFAIGAILLLARYALKPMLRLTASAKSHELFIAIILLIIGATALATQAVGLSMALGAFLAGMLLSETEYRHQIEVDIEPFRGLLLGMFFMSVGMNIDLLTVLEEIWLLLLAAIGLFCIKSLVLYGVLWLFRVERGTRLEAAMLLGQAGEFVFVILALAGQEGIIGREQAQFCILVASLTMLMTPLVARLGKLAADRLASETADGVQVQDAHADLEDHVIVGGFGRVGKIVAQVLETENIPYIALDRNAHSVNRERQAGHNVYFGDSGREDILLKTGAPKARAFIVTLDDPDAAERMVRAARKLCPNSIVIARAKDAIHARKLKDLEIDGVVPEAVEGSLRLAGRLLEGLGFPDEAVAKVMSTIRDMEDRRLN